MDVMEQIAKTLPRSAWESISIIENNEPLISIKETDRIMFTTHAKQNPEAQLIRKTVKNLLEKVSASLPLEYKLIVIEGYRSIASQQKSWDRIWQKIKEGTRLAKCC
jgi:hypothetical protein